MPKPSSARSTASKRSPVKRDETIDTVAFVSLGCPKNLVDSEKMLGLLAEGGVMPVAYDAAEAGEPVDAIVVNTCGFLEASKDESMQVIHDAIARKQAGQIKRVVVAGCLVQRHRAKMLEWAPGIDAMVGVFDRDKILEAVRGAQARERGERPRSAAEASDRPAYWVSANALVAAESRGMKTTGLTVQGKDGKGIGYFEDDSARLRLTPRHYAYLRISEGCNQNCAFCTIPSIRGKMRSKPLDRIAGEARELIADGAVELHLIGQDTTSYGDDIGIGLGAASATAHGSRAGLGLPGMLRAVSKAFDDSGVKEGWVRLMYAYPTNFTDECIDAIAGTARVLPYVDMPLQHASDAMLSAMRRNTTRAHQEGLMARLRKRIPGMAIRTTFISGFPGETEADHRELLDFVREQRFDAVGVFEYSHEPGTVAGTMEDDPKLAVSPDDKARRRGEIMALQQTIAFERNAELARKFDEKSPMTSGVRVDVMIDATLRSKGKATSGVGAGGRLYQGRTKSQAPQIDSVTFVQSAKELSPGEIVTCVITDHDDYDLVARPVMDLEKRVALKVL
ncbi:MAG: 30S ribosomal protein S12 methylthiotransferase RimO [Phycisphaerales bacterium]|nr:30S ribosomal protein S12 methylthiotransferase RimO [Phycisphaerales bacterium]